MFNRQEKTISEIEAENYEKYKDCDIKSYDYFWYIVLKGRHYYNHIQDKFEFSYLENNERQYKSFFSNESYKDFTSELFNKYIQSIEKVEKENTIKSSLIHIKHASPDDYLDIQSKLMKQGNKIIGVDVIYSSPPNPYVYVIKYQQPINSEIEQ